MYKGVRRNHHLVLHLVGWVCFHGPVLTLGPDHQSLTLPLHLLCAPFTALVVPPSLLPVLRTRIRRRPSKNTTRQHVHHRQAGQ